MSCLRVDIGRVAENIRELDIRGGGGERIFHAELDPITGAGGPRKEGRTRVMAEEVGREDVEG